MTEPELTQSDKSVVKATKQRIYPIGTNTGLKQAYDFRDLAAKEAMALQKCDCTSLEQRVTRARALKDLNSVWFASSERIRIMRGKPMPGSLRPVKAPKKVRTVSTKPLEQLPTDSTSTVQSSTEQSMLKESLTSTVPSPPCAGVDPV